jgi:Maltokinase N-terminal cap domain
VPVVARIHPGATLTPYFHDFLPEWVARQSWYPGAGTPSLRPVGYFRFEDPAGQVGIETHLVSDGAVLYQLPLTYRGSPMTDEMPVAEQALIATAEHSVLGTRWIYDGAADPVWISELLRLVETGGVSDPSGKRGVGRAEARGHLLIPGDLTAGTAAVELNRVVTAGSPADQPGVAGLVMGSWQPDGPGTATAAGCLAVVRKVT